MYKCSFPCDKNWTNLSKLNKISIIAHWYKKISKQANKQKCLLSKKENAIM